ncbi:histone-like nucleoid-structuring protein Lsr2 [Streptomyces sp. NPDC048211]|uniref:Lsr2 family DNA-binding protein n=1 Tax=Streptomyces sp. NPDC048211 TaxID=3365516 RepID=UPI0037149208
MTIAALRRLIEDETAAVPTPQTTARKRNPMSQPPAPQPSPTAPPLAVGKLLAWAEAHDTKFVVRKGEQARLLLRELRGLYAKDEERAEADAEEQRLLQQLEAVRVRKEQLRPRRKTSAPGYDQTTVRAWARENGHTVADRGSIPASVVDAWRASQTGGAQ